MQHWMEPGIRWAGGAAILSYAAYSFATHQDGVRTLVSVVIGGYLIVRGFTRR